MSNTRDISNKKAIINAIDLFKSHFGWVHVEDIKDILDGNLITFEDYEYEHYLIEVSINNNIWKNNKPRYNTLLFPYDLNIEVDYFLQFNKKCDLAVVAKKEDIVKPDNLIFKNHNDKDTGKHYYNKKFYEIHTSMCEFYIKEKDSWYEKD